MCDSLRLEMKYRDEFANDFMSQTYSSYMEYKYNYEESRLRHLIHSKYLKLLGRFIETTYPGLKFDVFIRNRDPKTKKVNWYGHTYMELKIFDIIIHPIYNPESFTPVYRTPHFDGYIFGEGIFNEIESFIPEINKHLSISFIPLINPNVEIFNFNHYEIPDYECWDEFFKRQSIKDATAQSYEDLFREPRVRNDFNPF